MWLKQWREEQQRNRELSLATLFAPAIEKAHADPRVLIVWQPLAKTLRARFGTEFAALDAASGSMFPFSKEFIAAAHSRWTADWLAWETSHDGEFKLRALVAQQELQGDRSDVARAKLEAIEREKLELYQRRYEEYVRVAKALQGLTP